MASSYFDLSNAFGSVGKGGFNTGNFGGLGDLSGGFKSGGLDRLGSSSGAPKLTVDKGVEFLSSFLDRQRDKYRSKAEDDSKDYARSLGSIDTRGFGGSQMFDNTFAIYSTPPSHPPFFFPGQSGGRGFSGGGAASGALSGALTGAKLGTIIPGIGNIGGAIAGGLIGAAGGGFG